MHRLSPAPPIYLNQVPKARPLLNKSPCGSVEWADRCRGVISTGPELRRSVQSRIPSVVKLGISSSITPFANILQDDLDGIPWRCYYRVIWRSPLFRPPSDDITTDNSRPRQQPTMASRAPLCYHPTGKTPSTPSNYRPGAPLPSYMALVLQVCRQRKSR